MSELYASMDSLTDYINEYANISAIVQMIRIERHEDHGYGIGDNNNDLRKALDEYPIKTVDERFQNTSPKLREEMRKFPEKVARLNNVATLANCCTDITPFKRIRNEVDRLLYGKSGRLPFPEPEFNPEQIGL
jgi:hypothetical protein